MIEDDHTTNVSTPSNTELENNTTKTQENHSTSSDTNRFNKLEKQEIGTYNLKCGSCNQIIATELEHEKQADHLLDKHQKRSRCDQAHLEFVQPQEPIEDQEETSVWKQIPAHILEEKIQDCSKETQKELAEKVHKAINQEGVVQ